MITHDKLLKKITEKHPELFQAPGAGFLNIAHDKWCNKLSSNSDECNCEPDFTYHVESGDYIVDLDGNCKLLEPDRN
jgi:hypothetical protein